MIFTSDNEGYIGIDGKRNLPVASNHPLQSSQDSLCEGGLRVPLWIRWPKCISAGAVCDQADILTELHLIPRNLCKLPQILPIDGINLSKLLIDTNAELPSRRLCFHFHCYYRAQGTTPCSGLVDGNRELITRYHTHHQEPYDLGLNPSEKTNLSDREHQRAEGFIRPTEQVA